MDKTQQVIEYLKEKYQPEAIILEGSRASEMSRDDSDWDLYLLVKDKSSLIGGWQVFEEQILDVNIIELPVADGYILKNSYGPIRFLKVLLDTENSLAQKIVERTQKAIKQKRPVLDTKDYQNRQIRLKGVVNKISGTKHSDLVCFYSICVLYELALRYWFELHQEWTLHPREAIPYLKNHDSAFYALLKNLVENNSWEEKAQIAQKIYSHLFD